MRIEPVAVSTACRLTAHTHAAFPGLAGQAYRAAVIGTGIHRRVMRRLLAQIKGRSERDPSA